MNNKRDSMYPVEEEDKDIVISLTSIDPNISNKKVINLSHRYLINQN